MTRRASKLDAERNEALRRPMKAAHDAAYQCWPMGIMHQVNNLGYNHNLLEWRNIIAWWSGPAHLPATVCDLLRSPYRPAKEKPGAA